MSTPPPTTIDDYIDAAPTEARPHLGQLRTLLQEVAPEAEETIKWGVPYFVEPRFLFSFSAFKHHLAFVPSEETLDAFREETGEYATTKNFLKVRYDQPLPVDLIRRMAEHRARVVSRRDDDSFW
jgi:uncharacterized protein YdhG (YjbR/CyaY superfamily)